MKQSFAGFGAFALLGIAALAAPTFAQDTEAKRQRADTVEELRAAGRAARWL
jgi:hypothetical protein